MHWAVILGGGEPRLWKWIGWMGVDLFFVLSGFLIVGQLLAEVHTGGKIRFGRFYLRRFLRIQPSYFVILAVFYGTNALGTGEPLPPFIWSAFLVQNFLPIFSSLDFTWSLCVEEHFYLLAPALVALAWRSGKPARWCVVLLVGGFLAQIAVRALGWQAHGLDQRPYPMPADSFVPYFKTWFRLDGLLVGAALASVKEFRPGIWVRWADRPGRVFLLSLVMLVPAALTFHSDGGAWGAVVFGYSALALGFGALLVSVSGPKSWAGVRELPGAGALARLAYALYLCNDPVLKGVRSLLATWGLPADGPEGIVLAVGSLLLSAILLHHGVERPFLALRSRLSEVPPRIASATPGS